VFSHRTPERLAPNRFAQAIGRAREARRDLIDLTESNPTKAGFGYPEHLLMALANLRGLEYDPRPLGLQAARRAVADDYRRRGFDVAPERIALTTSTSEAYSLLFKLLGDPGGDVLVPRPSYPLFDHLARLDGLAAVPYDLEYHGVWAIDFASVDRAVSERTRAVLVVSPNNPTGSFVKRDELEQLAEVCNEKGVALIADEVFADYELEPGAAARAARVLESDAPLVFSLGGLSKSAGLPQLKLGWVAIAGRAPLVEEALERIEFVCDTYLSVSTPIQAAAAELLAGAAPVRREIQARVAANYTHLRGQSSAAAAFQVLNVEGGWYAVLRVPSFEPEEDLVIDLIERDGVVTHPGYFFDFARESYLVISLLPPEATFARGVERVLRHFDCRVGRP
jgi:aspartate/methionine/tyrosine aminotransferase